MNWLRINRPCDHPTRRREGRRPLFEDLEGRRLLSDIVGNHIGMGVASSATVQVGHYSPTIIGSHIGFNVANSAAVQVVLYNTPHQGAHIGTAM
jgi:hypothetical protein